MMTLNILHTHLVQAADDVILQRMAGDPGQFQNFSISGATLLSNIYCGDTPPNGTEFARMISFRANGGNVTITWNSGSYQPYMILALVN